MAYTKYSLTPADNNAAPPNGAPEGMLPSAVNDTMRDMMSQVRDVGDGIRNGTYTMTAPVITGGSITGVALSGNTLTNPAITGGSINNTPIGAATANTGNFTTLGASSTATLNTLVSSGATITGGSISGVSLAATSPNFTTPILGTPTSGTLTNCTGLPVSTGVSGLGSNVATFLATPSSANLASAVTDETGTGALVFANSPALTTPNLGTPSAATLTNATGLPVATGISGLGTGVATFLATPSSANLKTAVTDETGSGALVFATSPTLVTPVLGVATATSVQGIIGNVTPAAGTFTTLTANGNTTLGDAAGDITTVPDLKALQVTSADRHSVRPSLLLDFANTKTLDPRITFTRASTASFYDGKTVAKAEENLFQYSEEFDNAYWGKSGIAVTANSDVAPNGASTADLIYATSSGSSNYIRTASPVTGLLTAHTISIFAKASGFSWFVVRNATSGADYVWFDVTNGVVGTQQNGATGTITSVGNDWYRCTVYTAAGWAANARFGISPTDANTSATVTASGTNGILLWGAQLENRTVATAYTATTTAPITNYIPALQTAASGVARFEHNPITGESLGLEIEEQRTNLLTYSDNFSNAVWSTFQASLQSNVAIAPDGTLTADLSIPDATNSTVHGVYPTTNTTVSNATAYTLTVYAKAAGNNFLSLYFAGTTSVFGAVFNLSTGVVGSKGSSVTSSSITAVGNGWYRCSMTATTVNTAAASRIYSGNADNNDGTVTAFAGNGYSGIYIWGAQLEAGAFATSYIPTVASQVTRLADSATMTGTNFSSWYRADEGTIYSEGQALQNNNGIIADINSDATNRIFLACRFFGVSGTAGSVTLNNISQSNTFGNFGFSSVNKSALAYKANDFGATINGQAVTTDSAGNIPVVNKLDIGVNLSNTALKGHLIKKLAYYPARLTNAELQGVTTV